MFFVALGYILTNARLFFKLFLSQLPSWNPAGKLLSYKLTDLITHLSNQA